MKVRIKWVESVAFLGESESGHAIVMDGALDGGGRNLGPRPMETVLIGTGGCTAYDVVHILKKQRADLRSLEARFSGRRSEAEPRRFLAIDLHFALTGDLTPDRIERALALSRDKYCSVWHSMRPDIEFRTTFAIEGR